MKHRNSTIETALSVALLAGAALSAFPASAGAQGKSSHTATSELKWLETPIGPLASPVRGDFTKGAHVTYLKFPAGVKTPPHSHSANYVGIVLSGNARHPVDGVPGTEKILPAGSHWFMPANVKHVSECLPGAECVMALIQDEKFDFLPTEKAK